MMCLPRPTNPNPKANPVITLVQGVRISVLHCASTTYFHERVTRTIRRYPENARNFFGNNSCFVSLSGGLDQLRSRPTDK